MKVQMNAYRDAAKADLVDTVEINDLGMVGGAGREPSSDELLIQLARAQIVGEGKATDQEASDFHYEVVRSG